MSEDYRDWHYEDLIEEIHREEEALKELHSSLEEAVSEVRRLEEAIEEERLPRYPERLKRRAERIENIRRVIEEWNIQIRRVEERIARRSETITSLDESIARQEARLRRPFISPTERYIIRGVIRRLRRSRGAYLGWQTRDGRTLETLKRLRAHDIRVLGGYTRWQVEEEPLRRRLIELRGTQRRLRDEIRRLRTTIEAEEARLERKREALPKFFKSHVIISLDYAEDHLFELHIICPHLDSTLTEDDKNTLAILAYELMIDYGVPERLLTHRDTEFNFGEVQTKPVEEFNFETEAVIFDVKVSGKPTRAVYSISWYIETRLDGTQVVRYKSFEAVLKGKMDKEELQTVTTDSFRDQFEALTEIES